MPPFQNVRIHYRFKLIVKSIFTICKVENIFVHLAEVSPSRFIERTTIPFVRYIALKTFLALVIKV